MRRYPDATTQETMDILVEQAHNYDDFGFERSVINACHVTPCYIDSIACRECAFSARMDEDTRRIVIIALSEKDNA